MEDKIKLAVKFIGGLIKKTKMIPVPMVDRICSCLSAILYNYYIGHWYPLCPSRGQAYRCLRHNSAKGLEPLVHLAALQAHINPNLIVLPAELTVWIDPDEVGYRIGETIGSYCHLTSENVTDDYTIELTEIAENSSSKSHPIRENAPTTTNKEIGRLSAPCTPTKQPVPMLSHPSTPTTKCTPAELASGRRIGSSTHTTPTSRGGVSSMPAAHSTTPTSRGGVSTDNRRVRSCNTTPVRRVNIARRGSTSSSSSSASSSTSSSSCSSSPVSHTIEPLCSSLISMPSTLRENQSNHHRDRTLMPPPTMNRAWNYDRSQTNVNAPISDKVASTKFTTTPNAMRLHPDLVRA